MKGLLNRCEQEEGTNVDGVAPHLVAGGALMKPKPEGAWEAAVTGHAHRAAQEPAIWEAAGRQEAGGMPSPLLTVLSLHETQEAGGEGALQEQSQEWTWRQRENIQHTARRIEWSVLQALTYKGGDK